MSLSVGDQIGRYEILEPIGAGSMGQVWVLATPIGTRQHGIIMPTGPGSAITLPPGPLVGRGEANFLPDGRQIVFAGREQDHLWRDAVFRILITPDGKAYCHDYVRVLSELSVVEGLK